MVEELTLRTADGERLEAEYSPADEPVATAVLCHPHPQYGGSMRAGVIDELFHALPTQSISTLRFNFRGVEGSTGSFGGGIAEQQDVIAAIGRAVDLGADGQKIFTAAWSFGADVSLCVSDSRLSGWFLIAPPLGIVERGELLAAADPRPKFLAVPEHDQYRPPASAREEIADWPATDMDVVAGADHFLGGAGNRVIELVTTFALGLQSV